MKPFLASGSFGRRSVIEITMSSGTSCPASMYAFAFFPRSVPCATLCRKMLPVEMCGTPRYAASFAAWVPLPAPGGPSRTSLMSRRERSQRSKDFGLGVHLDWDTILPVEDPGQPAILFSAVRSPAPCNFDSREASRYAGDDDKEPKEFHGRGRDRGRCPDSDRNGPHEVRGGRSVGDNDTDDVGRRPILEELVRRGGRSDGRVVDGPPVREWIAIRVRRDDYERLSHRRIQDHRRPWARGDDCGPSVPDSDCLHHLARPTEIVHDDEMHGERPVRLIDMVNRNALRGPPVHLRRPIDRKRSRRPDRWRPSRRRSRNLQASLGPRLS